MPIFLNILCATASQQHVYNIRAGEGRGEGEGWGEGRGEGRGEGVGEGEGEKEDVVVQCCYSV